MGRLTGAECWHLCLREAVCSVLLRHWRCLPAGACSSFCHAEPPSLVLPNPNPPNPQELELAAYLAHCERRLGEEYERCVCWHPVYCSLFPSPSR